MSNAQVTSQLNQLLTQLGNIAATTDSQFLNDSTRLMSVAFGYKLIELALLSLCVTARTQSLLPETHEEPQKGGLLSYAELLYEYGLIEHENYERLLRINTFHKVLDQELAFFNQKSPAYDDILGDIRHVLQATETVVQEFCQGDYQAVGA